MADGVIDEQVNCYKVFARAWWKEVGMFRLSSLSRTFSPSSSSLLENSSSIEDDSGILAESKFTAGIENVKHARLSAHIDDTENLTLN